MISFDEFLKQDECDKYNMLQECNAIIQQKENIINTFDTFIEEVYNHINLGDESEEFILVLNKWLELNKDNSMVVEND